MQSHIRTGRVAVVHPPHKVSAEISRDYLQRWLRGKGKSEELIAKLNSLLDRSQIKTRYILLSPMKCSSRGTSIQQTSNT